MEYEIEYEIELSYFPTRDAMNATVNFAEFLQIILIFLLYRSSKIFPQCSNAGCSSFDKKFQSEDKK